MTKDRNMKKISLITLLFISYSLISQDTLTVLHYNLLNYGNYTDYCTSENNNIALKDQYIKTIIEYTKPDIFTVNEISNSLAIQQRMLDNNLNTGGIDYYKKANFIKDADSYIVNAMYYNSQKLILKSHTIAQSYIRDIDLYELYYRSDDLKDGDTAFLNCIVAHLKSSSGDQNQEKRRKMISNTINYLESYNPPSNSLFLGDFNIYSSSEPAYQLLINNQQSDIVFNDPINTPGAWHNSYTYRNVHTQSTHSSQNGCAASGGMDDRFDFILISDNILAGSADIQYVNNSYLAIGQDGLHFNKSIISAPENLSAPAEVIDALYGNSDHLPILLKLSVDKTLGVNDGKASFFQKIKFQNPLSEKLKVEIWSTQHTNLVLDIISVTGRNVFSQELVLLHGRNELLFNLRGIPKGIYFAVFTDDNKNKVVRKVVIN